MYFPDLSNYEYLARLKLTSGVNIGWLSVEYTFTTGASDSSILAILKQYPLQNLCRGFHLCEFCDNGVMGNGEIHVKGGELFIAPSLIIHYIEVHKYLPPSVFIDAINFSNKRL